MSIFICVFVLISCASCALNENEDFVRLKREPPVYRPVTIYRSVFGLPRYGPPKLNYGPPKPIYGPPKSYYGPAKPIYGPPRLIYRPRSIYDYQVSNYPPYYHRPPPNYYAPPPPPPTHYGIPSPLIYGPPTSSYDVSIYPSTGTHSYPTRPSQSHGEPASSDLPPLPPSDNYGSLVENYGPTYSAYNTQSSSTGYDGTYSPPQPFYTSYGSPSQEPREPSRFESSDNYAKLHSSYEVPITQSPPTLQYDTSSASYGTPGAVTSYGTPVGNHELKNMQKRINSPYLQEPFTIFEEGDNYGSSSDIAHIGEPFKVASANRTCRHKENFVTRSVEKVALNHNYDGPGVGDDIETQKENSRKKAQIKRNPIITNYLKEHEYLNECN